MLQINNTPCEVVVQNIPFRAVRIEGNPFRPWPQAAAFHVAVVGGAVKLRDTCSFDLSPGALTYSFYANCKSMKQKRHI